MMLYVCIGLLCTAGLILVYPLVNYIGEVKDAEVCMQCERKCECLALKKTIGGKTTYIDGWMLFTLLVEWKKCRCFKSKRIQINWLLLLAGVVVFAIPLWLEGNMQMLLYSIASMALLFLAIVDWNTQYIPLEMNIVILICGLVRLVTDLSNWLEYILGFFLVSGFLYVVNKVATPVLKRRYEDDTIEDVIGDGDMKLMAATGLLLGWKLNFIALGLGCVIGSIIQIILMKVKGSDRQFALGPYLSLGVYITMICGEQLVGWYLNIIGIVPM